MELNRSYAIRDARQREPEAGYHMIKTFEVESFECFDSVRLADLTRINVVTGPNASGKTALLEALFFATRATPDGVLTLNRFRGLQVPSAVRPAGLPFNIVPQVTPAVFRSLWDHWFRFFPGKDGTPEAAPISFKYSDSRNKRYQLDVSIGQTSAPVATQTDQATTSEVANVAPITFQRRMDQQSSKSVASLNPDGNMVHQPLKALGPAVAIFPSVANYAESDNVTWLSRMKEEGRGVTVDENIRAIFPFIKNLEVLAPQGTLGIYANLESGGIRRIQQISSGIYKIVTLLLACSQTKNGIVLIDEIENGIFYEKYGELWSSLYRIAQQSQAQLFISSHSSECLEALVPVMEENISDFSLIRTERVNGKCTVRHVSGASMKAALKRQGEIRGATDGKSTAQNQ
jgi:hypothetical protein